MSIREIDLAQFNEFAHQQIEGLVVAGGDGMVHLGVNLVTDAIGVSLSIFLA